MNKLPVKMEWLMETKLNPDADMSLARMTVAAGVTSELHHHTNCSETLHLVSGQVSQRIGDDWIVMNEGDTCLIKIGQLHQTQNLGETEAVLMIAYSAGERVYIKS